MLRFPNPGSDIQSMIRLFQSLFEELSNQTSFSLDDMSKAMVMNNLAASCGRMGDEALARSTREDRTRDPLYNQSKMYSELFRALGWITSMEGSRLSFQFTTLGAYISKAGSSADELVKLCIVGISFPNPVLDIKYPTCVRPFVCILRAMSELDGILSRDEMILGPMSIRDDRDTNVFSRMIETIKCYRKNKDISIPLTRFLTNRRIAKPTSENYTRFPLGVLRWSQWATTCELNIYKGRLQRFYKLTDKGFDFLQRTRDYKDIRASDLEKMNQKAQKAFVENSFFSMLDKSNFDLSPIQKVINDNNSILNDYKIDASKIFFSPYQELDRKYLEHITDIPVVYYREDRTSQSLFPASELNGTASSVVYYRIDLSHSGVQVSEKDDELSTIWRESNCNLTKAVTRTIIRHENDNKDVFYPLVARLFSVAGFPCQTSRTGVNYQRWDASIELNGFYLPIEIKSPGEEKQLSVKAIRQALENHIVLLSRLPGNSKPEHTSLAVGFQYPNNRAEVNELIENINKAFNIRIGVLDFKTLVSLAYSSIFLGNKMSSQDLENLYGFLDINV